MSLQENKAIVRRFIEEVQNQHNLAVVDELFSPDYIDHMGRTNPPGPEGVKATFTMMFAVFPDWHFTIRMQLAEGDQVVTYKTARGTHLGPFMGIPPTGKSITFELIDIMTVKDGKITDHWAIMDDLSLLQQLGVVPAPA